MCVCVCVCVCVLERERKRLCAYRTDPQVPGHDMMFHRKKMHPQLFGINSHGVFSVNKETGEVCIIRLHSCDFCSRN